MRATSGHPAAHPQSLRSFLEHLDENGEILRIRQEVRPVHEIGAFLWETASSAHGAARAAPAVIFESVEGHDLAVVGNVLTSRHRAAAALHTSVDELHRLLADATSGGPAPVVVSAAPCQDAHVTRPDLGSLPVPTFFPNETGPYITAGVIVAKGATAGATSLSHG